MSNVPPPFSAPSAPRKKDKTGLIVLVLILSVVGICVIGLLAVSWGIFKGMGAVRPLIACEMNYTAMSKAIEAYAKEHDGKLPRPANWQSDLKPYVKKELETLAKEMEDAPDFIKGEQMNVDGPWGCDLGDNKKSGVAYNTDVDGKKLADLSSTETPIIFEVSEAKVNASAKYKALPYKDSPKIMGNSRGWMVITDKGVGHVSESGRILDEPATGGGFRSRTEFDSSSDSPPEPNEPGAPKSSGS